MSELKVYHCNEWHNEYTEFYIKSEADKVIADLEEKHKKEVGQLLIEIVELKEKRDTAGKLLNKALYCVSNGKNHMMSLARKKNHSDYKRCLAMAEWCDAEADVADADGDYEDMRRYQKWHRRWLAIAEQFKEAK